MPRLITTLGRLGAGQVGMILPHEHVFVDLRTGNPPGYAQADVADVIKLMSPELERAKQAGVTAIVECSPIGVGRRADILKAVSDATQFPLLVPTGIYREPWIPQWAHDASEDALYDWMLKELTDQIENTGVQAAWVKLSAGDLGLTATETKILRAAARAGTKTNAVIGSHTISGKVVRDQLGVIEEVGYTPHRFIWIHAQNEWNLELHLEFARRGAYVEYDAIGGGSVGDGGYIERIQRLLEKGLGTQILLSHDRGWYDASAKPSGGTPRPFTYISETFLPQLRQAGVDEATVKQLTHANPFRAFAR